ncbi:serine hydrolase domain-containing protein [Alteromonas sp. CYL-A6]|uniref:serine hydrolase domain-containing protein n=1 Tax=Alteromonas nitratireducens TaxID=3390813 RepID=UPI0034A6CFC3
MLKFICTLLLTCILLITSNHAFAQSPAKTLNGNELEIWFDAWLNHEIKQQDLAGVTVSVVQQDEVVFSKGYGYADVETKTPLTAYHLVRPGSIAKLFTWTAVMQLVERGQLSLDADIRQYLDFDLKLQFDEPVTMRHLMTHTAGFSEVAKGLFASQTSPNSNELWLKAYTPTQSFKPGTVPSYSNYGVSLAGYIVERISGLPFEDYVDTAIFKPLKMQGASFKNQFDDTAKKMLVSSYALASQPAKPFEAIAGTPAGSLSISANDMAKFMIAHLNDGKWQDTQLLSATTINLMHNYAAINIQGLNAMALGFYRADRNGHTIIGHGGDTLYHHSDLKLLPNFKTGIFISISGIGKDGAAYKLRPAIINRFIDRYFPCDHCIDVNSETEVIAGSEMRAAKVAGNYISSRTSFDTLLQVGNLFQQLSVTALPNGDLLIPAFAQPSGQPWIWREISPYLWQQIGGQEKISVSLDANDNVIKLSTSSLAPIASWLPAAASQNSTLHLLLLGLSALTALGALLNLIAEKYISVRHGLMLNKPNFYTHSRIASLTLILALASWGLVLTMMSQLNASDLVIRIAQLLTLASIVGTFFTGRYTFAQLRHGAGKWKKLRALLLLLGSIYFALITISNGMLSLSLNY